MYIRSCSVPFSSTSLLPSTHCADRPPPPPPTPIVIRRPLRAAPGRPLARLIDAAANPPPTRLLDGPARPVSSVRRLDAAAPHAVPPRLDLSGFLDDPSMPNPGAPPPFPLAPPLRASSTPANPARLLDAAAPSAAVAPSPCRRRLDAAVPWTAAAPPRRKCRPAGPSERRRPFF